ncbi:hypothetical protein QJQ45_013106 [Haematococcus lacustris]|nr:hypothetical protein QJQ45_013106 [Haematococcus lacustris]
MRKKVDSRIRTLVENCVKLRQRALMVIIGDKAREQVVNLHYMLSKASVKARPTVLWCYKKDLYLSSNRKKRVKQIKKMAARGLLDPEKEDPFALFVASTSIRYCFYSETQNILGNTFGMAVLQDFEALTPNLLARTVETVEGGGLVVLLLSNLQSLTQLYSLTMDCHSRLRTESHQDVRGRFNERLVLSLANCPTCLMMDDELNVLPTSSLDQARAVVTFLDAASEKTLRSTVALTASRGRGKSAALGLAMAGALALGYANIFVTAPSPENLKTLFTFLLKASYKEHLDYDLVESSNPVFGRCLVRVNVFRNHRQTVQYILPQHHAKLAQAELLIIDEAAAIPLTTELSAEVRLGKGIGKAWKKVRKGIGKASERQRSARCECTVRSLLGPYLVFLCSTVNGYEAQVGG